jgi:hypothetical protein
MYKNDFRISVDIPVKYTQREWSSNRNGLQRMRIDVKRVDFLRAESNAVECSFILRLSVSIWPLGQETDILRPAINLFFTHHAR